MRFSKKIVRGGVFFATCASIIMGAGATLGACGGGDDTPASPDQDASSEATVGDDGGTAALDLRADNVTVYVGQLVRLDAAQSKAPNGAAVTYSWSVKSTPVGSAVTTATLAGATSEVVTFTADRAGDYVLTLSGAAGGEMATKDVTATAVNGQVFFTLTNGNANPPFTEMDTVEMDGKNQHPIDCRQPIRIPLGSDAGLNIGDGGPSTGLALVLFASLFADTALDSWEGPPGTPARAAFQNIIFFPDGGIQEMGLAAATTANTCQKPPARVHTISVAGKSAPAVFQPRFSPNGERIAFVEEQASGNEYVSVVGFDGADYHQIASYCPDADAANTSCHGSTAFGPRRPQWVDDSHLGWSRELAHTSSGTGAAYVESSTWEIVTVPDVAGAVPTRFMGCTTASMPLSIGFLATGEVIANFKRTSTSAEDIVVLTADASKNCQIARSLTNLVTVGSYARDFAISPDGTMVAYMQNVAAADAGVSDGGLSITSGGGILYTVPVDGSSAPKQVSPEALIARFGPRWIAAGSHLAWNGGAPPPAGYDGGVDLTEAGLNDAGGVPSMNVIRVDGTGGVVHAAIGDPLNGSYVIGGGNGGACSIECIPQACATPGCEVATTKKNVTGTALTGSSLLGLLFLARRRTRKQK